MLLSFHWSDGVGEGVNWSNSVGEGVHWSDGVGEGKRYWPNRSIQRRSDDQVIQSISTSRICRHNPGSDSQARTTGPGKRPVPHHVSPIRWQLDYSSHLRTVNCVLFGCFVPLLDTRRRFCRFIPCFVRVILSAQNGLARLAQPQ